MFNYLNFRYFLVLYFFAHYKIKYNNSISMSCILNYYEPKSIVNYSTSNFSNEKHNNKYQSLSVSKDSKKSNNIINKTLDTINKNFFNLINSKLVRHTNEPSQTIKKIEIKDKKTLNEEINKKNEDIEKINRLISKMKNQITKYDTESRIIDNLIRKEEQEGEVLRQMINFINSQ